MKIPMMFLVEIYNLILKFIWKFKGTRIAKTILKKINKVRRLKSLDFKIHSKATVVEREWHWYLGKEIDQWNRIGILGIELHISGQLIFDKDAKGNSKDSLLINDPGTIKFPYAQILN